MYRFTLSALTATVLLAASAGSRAADEPAIGFVKTATPQAQVIAADGQAQPARPGLAVRRGDRLKTGAGGSLGLALQDDTAISIGPDTEASVDDFVYAPARGELALGATLSRGTLHYVSGVIAKLKPEAVTIRTPSGTIGVRGTRFVARVEPEDAAPVAR